MKGNALPPNESNCSAEQPQRHTSNLQQSTIHDIRNVIKFPPRLDHGGMQRTIENSSARTKEEIAEKMPRQLKRWATVDKRLANI